jgi:hypothetical protein
MAADNPATTERTIHLCGYMDMALDDVVALFARPDIERVLEESLRSAMGSAGERMTLHASSAERLSDATARLTVDWRSTDRAGAEYEGTATISLLRVQSGADSITEVLMALPVAASAATSVAASTRRFLDDVTSRLASAAA